MSSTLKKNSHKKLEKRLRSSLGKAINDYQMIKDNDLVMVCLSGGKDSYTMLELLISLKRNSQANFDLIAVNLDQNHPGFPSQTIPKYLSNKKIPYKIIKQDTYSVVNRIIPGNKTKCSLCSRMRRGALYKTAKNLGVTKIALGHHRDDILETFFLNLFFGGRLKAMPPKVMSEDKYNVVIRPLAYCKEKDIKNYAEEKKFPIIPCNLCGSQKNSQRAQIKEMLNTWEQLHPGRIESIFSSLQRVTPSHLLDKKIHDFFFDAEQKKDFLIKNAAKSIESIFNS